MNENRKKRYLKTVKVVQIMLKNDFSEHFEDFCADLGTTRTAYAKAALFEKLEKDGFFDDFPNLKVRKK